MKYLINSDASFRQFVDEIGAVYHKHKYLRITLKTGKDRTIDQNSLIYAWYEQIARELPDDDALGWRCYCKLHHGVPIMREDDEFRAAYDTVIKPLSYEKKLIAMRCWPVTSLMTKRQLRKYADAVMLDFKKRGVNIHR